LNDRLLPEGTDLVYFAGGEWNVYPPRGYDLMKVFASRGTRVLWVDPGATRVPKVAVTDLARIGTRIRRILSGTRPELANLWVCSPLAIPFESRPWVRKTNLRFQSLQLKKALSKLGMRGPVVWSTTPLAIEVIESLDSSLFLYDIQDEYTKFPGKDHLLISTCEARALSACDLAFVVSDRLRETKKADSHAEIRLLRNGVDFDLFRAACEPRTEIPDEVRDIRGPVAGYVGNVYDRLDQDLVARTAERLPDWSFVFVGLVRCGVERLSRMKNVSFLGMKPPSQLPGYLKRFDVGIIPHKVDSFTVCQNPVKLYEYLAAGLPIVSTDLPELEPYRDFVLFADTPEAFSDALKRAREGNSPVRIPARQQVAMQNRWTARAEQAAAHIRERLHSNKRGSGPAPPETRIGR
jgi:glycosyltransferase involved in cell wall biosynthesis